MVSMLLMELVANDKGDVAWGGRFFLLMDLFSGARGWVVFAYLRCD